MMFVASASVSLAQLVDYQAPTPTVPGIQSAPGQFPLTVTSTNIISTNPPGTELGGDDRDLIFLQISNSGPIEWTSSRYNAGDIAVNVGPNPGGGANSPPGNVVNSFQEGNNQDPNLQAFPTTHAWRLNSKLGIPLATVTQNGVGENNTVGGNSIPLYGTAQFTNSFSQGVGYNMVNGVYGNGDGGSGSAGGAVDLNMGIAGFNTLVGSTEGTFNVAASFFPYGQDEGTANGWIGGYVNSQDIGPGGAGNWVGGTYNGNFDPSESFSGSSYPGGESPMLSLDGNVGTKYLNFAGPDSGIIVTPSFGDPTIATGLQLTTANDAPGRDPTSYQVFGTNDPITSSDNSLGNQENWTLISSGSVSLPDDRFTPGSVINFSNSTEYDSYRILFPGTKGDSLFQIAEIDLLGDVPAQSLSGVDLLSSSDDVLAVNTVDVGPDPSNLPSYNVNFFGQNGPPVTWDPSGNAMARLESPDFTPADGLLFVGTADGDNDNEFAVATPNGSGWDIAVYANDDNSLRNLNADAASGTFSFLFVDFDSQGLTGGLIDGETGNSIEERETGQAFELTRLSTGVYQLSIDGVTPDDGMLILTNAGGDTPSFLSYEEDGNGNFIIQSRFVENGDLASGNASFPLVDTDFAFAYVDFTNPLAPPLPQNGGGPGDPGRVIPEPSSIALLIGGLAMGLSRRRRS